jgi:chromosome segregation ATPase
MAQLPQEGSTGVADAETQLQLAGGRVRELEGQVQEAREVQRRHKDHLDDLKLQLGAARRVQQAWQRAVGATRDARAKAAAVTEGVRRVMGLEDARRVVRKLEQRVEAVRKEEGGLMQRLEDARVGVREQEEEVAAVSKARDEFFMALGEAREKLQQREEEVAGLGEEDGREKLLQVEAARMTLQAQEEAVADVLEARGELGVQLEAARGVARVREEELEAVREASQDLQLQLEAARGLVQEREVEVAAVGRADSCAHRIQLQSTAAPMQQQPQEEQRNPQLQHRTLGQQPHLMADALQSQDAGRAACHQLPQLQNSSARVSGTDAVMLASS